MTKFKEGDEVKFKVRSGYGGTNPYFYGTVVKRGKELRIEGDEYEDSFKINDDYLTNLTKL